jgi:O-methyltransferase
MSDKSMRNQLVAEIQAAAEKGDVIGVRKLMMSAMRGLDESPAFFVFLAESLLSANPTDPAHVAEVEALLGFAESPDAIVANGAEKWPLRAQMILGHMYLGLGRLEDACTHFRKAYNWRPYLADTAEMYVTALNRLGRHEQSALVEREHRVLNDLKIASLPQWQAPAAEFSDARNLYLDLLVKVVCNWIYGDVSHPSYGDTRFSPSRREIGRDLPTQAHSMIGLRRLTHLRWAVQTVLDEDVEGDFLEAGVWRGGACIVMRGVLAAYGVKNRKVFVADSFNGLPPPDPRFDKDVATLHTFHGRSELAVSQETVRENFAMYDLLDEHVVFVPGLFQDTLPKLDVARLAVLRIDGDLYASTLDTLEALYDKVVPGGFLICDDYGAVIDSQRAILDFRAARHIETPMVAIDQDGVFWRKSE